MESPPAVLGAVLDAMDIGVCLLDTSGKIVHTNARFLEKMGFVIDPVRPLWEQIGSEELRELLLRPLQGRISIRLPARAGDGSAVWFGHIKEIPGTGILLTEDISPPSARSLETWIGASRALEQLPIGLALIEATPKGVQILDYNERYVEILGARPNSGTAFGQLPFQVYHSDRSTPYPQADLPGPLAARTGSSVFDRELHVLRSDNQWRVLSVSAAPTPDATPTQRHSLSYLLDITDRWNAEQEMYRGYTLYRAVVGHISDMLVLFSSTSTTTANSDSIQAPESWVIRDISDRIAGALALTREQAIGALAIDLLPDNTRRVAPRWAEVLETGVPYTYEMSYIGRVYLVRAFRVDASTIGSASIDITERYEAEARVEAERERLRVTLSSIGDAVITTDAAARITMMNPIAAQLTGWSEEQAVGQSLSEVFDIVDEFTGVTAESPAARVLRDGRIIGLANHTSLRSRDGTLRPIADSGAPIRDASGRIIGVVLVFRDQSDERLVQDVLQRSRAELQELIERLPFGVFVTRDDRIIYANPTFSRCFPPGEQLLGMRPDQLLVATERASRWHVKSCSDRTTILEIGEARAITLDGLPAALWIAQDLTELVETQARLVQSDRLAAIGTLAAAVAHEINNPLSYVTAALEFIDEQLQASEGNSELIEAISEAREGAARVEHVVRDLKRISRGGEGRAPRAIVDLRSVLESSVHLASNEIRHRAQLSVQIAPTPAVLGDEPALGQVLLNLLLNAAQAIPSGDEHAEITVIAGTDPRGWAQIEVCDTGVGIPEEHLGSIFEAFFTTKPVGVGTGLGLWICKNTIEQHGGEISLHNREGRGTIAKVALPPAQSGAPERVNHPAIVLSGVRGRVLVIDDEPSIGVALRRMLNRQHDVTLIGNPLAARARLAAGERFEIVLCDVMMREMNGVELWREIHTLSPEQAQRFVFISGGAFQPEVERFFQTSDHLCIDKPFDVATLRGIVDQFVRKPW